MRRSSVREDCSAATGLNGYTSDGFDGHNKGHAYGMFNAFKGLKLYNIQTLPGVGRAAGPGRDSRERLARRLPGLPRGQPGRSQHS